MESSGKIEPFGESSPNSVPSDSPCAAYFVFPSGDLLVCEM